MVKPYEAWKEIPLTAIIPRSHLLDKMYYAGYETAGDVLDATPEEMALNVKGLGIKRATNMRQKVFNAVRPNLVAEPNWKVVEIVPDDHRPNYRIDDLIATAAMLTGLAMMVYFFARLVLTL